MTFQEHLDATRDALGRADWSAAARALDAAEALARDEAQHALVQMHRASIPVLRGEAGADLRVFRENFLRRHSPRHVAIAGYYILVDVLHRGDLGTAERYLPAYLEAVRELDEPHHWAAARDLESTVDSLRGRHVAAIERHRATLMELQSYDGADAPLLRATALHNLVYDCLAANRFAEALQSVEASIAAAERLGRADYLAQVLVTASFAHLCGGSLDDAERLATRAEPVAAGQRLERYVHYVRGEVARRRGDVEGAAACFQRLAAFYPEIPGVAEMLLSMNVAPFLLPE